MSDQSSLTLNTDRYFRLALIVGVAALVIAGVGLLISGPAAFFQAYLFSFLFWLGISLGSLSLLLLFFIVNSRWGLALRRITEAGAASLWVIAILFIPVVIGAQYLYPWTSGLGDNPSLAFKAFYLSLPFWIVRAVIFFALWIGISMLITNRSARLQASEPAQRFAVRGRTQVIAALSAVVLVFSMTFASFDWIMSLQPLWNSTAFGLITVVGQALSALAFAILVLNLFPALSLGHRWTVDETPVGYKDLGPMMLTFVIGWMYLMYFQFLIMWGGNIPREVIWFQDRNTGGWQVLSWIIVVFQFVLPFLILLSGRVRHNLRLLAGLAGMLLVIYLINTFWHVKPAFSPGAFAFSWIDLVMPFAIGGIWLAVFFRTLQRRPALSPADEVTLEMAPAKPAPDAHS